MGIASAMTTALATASNMVIVKLAAGYVNALIIYTLQAMGKGIHAAVLTICRQGLLNIPCLILMNHIFGLYGMIWVQLIMEALMLPVTIGMYAVTWRKLTKQVRY